MVGKRSAFPFVNETKPGTQVRQRIESMSWNEPVANATAAGSVVLSIAASAIAAKDRWLNNSQSLAIASASVRRALRGIRARLLDGTQPPSAAGLVAALLTRLSLCCRGLNVPESPSSCGTTIAVLTSLGDLGDSASGRCTRWLMPAPASSHVPSPPPNRNACARHNGFWSGHSGVGRLSAANSGHRGHGGK